MRLICESMQMSRDVMTQVEREEAEASGDKIYTGKERNWAVMWCVTSHGPKKPGADDGGV